GGAGGGRVACLLLLAAGCGPGDGTVTGEVSYDGQPVGRGMITFAPADGQGPTVGGPITSGRYAVDKVPPGRKDVKIEAVKDVPVARDSEDMAPRAPPPPAPRAAPRPLAPPDGGPPHPLRHNAAAAG